MCISFIYHNGTAWKKLPFLLVSYKIYFNIFLFVTTVVLCECTTDKKKGLKSKEKKFGSNFKVIDPSLRAVHFRKLH